MTEKIQLTNTRYRLGYHIMAPAGWINDPNGFCYFQGYYHIFYQHYPNDAKWGPMHWGHARSRDLAHWETLPIALTPGDPEDQDGCFSGSAVVHDNKMYLIYTGHHYYDDGDAEHFWQNQNLAISEDGIHFKKYAHNPIIAQAPQDNTQHFRDPKVWYNNGHWYLILGSQNNDQIGRVLLYQSENLIDWHYIGVTAQSKAASQEGRMWECPDFFRLGDDDVLLMSPQGIEATANQFKNLHETGYLVGKYQYHDNTFKRGQFTELDNGHDFYATQTMLTPDNRRLVIGWMAMWESAMPESADGWAGALTLPRELVYQNNRLQMRPIKELDQLRVKQVVAQTKPVKAPQLISAGLKQYEAQLEIDMAAINQVEISLQDTLKRPILTLKYNQQMGQLVLNRTGADPERTAPLQVTDTLSLQLYVDTSSVEIFVNNGERTFTERFYADAANLSLMTDAETTAAVTVYELEKHAIKF
ncbi:sucrose-6-phosphate hydrolase [Lactobacillus sp. CBA3605]|uniref:glycoside hydrolase family 32 protein n=1 Tax=Lactobacillus sp. CBA3605 TaxID=2099788 RepID=UPI000CFE2504|nr:glycoside hydrolase family 32 protein [Lactobacillus sp. CBA3605]AVK61149.1 sucrose-6-phosphate hydrolase [Lactobacillus sp. CBA3605]